MDEVNPIWVVILIAVVAFIAYEIYQVTKL